jgi:hypothetical protein
MTSTKHDGDPEALPHRPKPFKFTVDGRPYESDDPTLTGQQIKRLAGVDASFGLFLEGHGHHPDQPIADTEKVDLRAPGKEHFFSAPPATYGAQGT